MLASLEQKQPCKLLLLQQTAGEYLDEYKKPGLQVRRMRYLCCHKRDDEGETRQIA